MLSPFRILIFFIALAGAGIATLPYLLIDIANNAYLAEIEISYNLPKTSPQYAEQYVTAVLENTFSQLKDLKYISSTSTPYGGRIVLKFDKNTDIAFQRFEITNLIRQIYPQLPIQTSYPKISEGASASNEDPNETPLLLYAIYSDLPAYLLKEKIENQFKLNFLDISEIDKIQVYGLPEDQIEISYQMAKLKKYGLQPKHLLDALQQYTEKKFLGQIYLQNQSYFLYTQDLTQQNIEQLAQIPIHCTTTEGQGQKPILLSEVAQIYFKEAQALQHYRINGKEAINIAFYAKKNVNKLILSQAIRQRVAQIATQYSELSIALETDQVKKITEEWQNIVYRSCLSVMLIVIFMLLTRPIRQVFLLLGNMLVTLALLLGVLHLLQLPIYFYTLIGINLGFSLFIANALLMLHYLTGYKYKHIVSFWASSQARTIYVPMACTIAALSGVYVLPIEQYAVFRDIIFAMSLTLGVSIIVLLGLLPACWAIAYTNTVSSINKLNKTQYKWYRYYQNVIYKLRIYRRWLIIIIFLSLGTPLFLLPTSLPQSPLYNATLGNEWYVENIKPYIDLTSGGVFRLFWKNIYAKANYQEPAETMLYIRAELTPENTTEQLNVIIKQLEDNLQNLDVQKFSTYVTTTGIAYLYIYFDEKVAKTQIPFEVKNKIIELTINLGGVSWAVTGLGDGFSNLNYDMMSNFRIEMRGYNLEELGKQAQLFAQKLIENKRIQKINLKDKYDWGEKQQKQPQLHPNPYMQAILGVTNQDILQAIYTYAYNPYAQTFLYLQDKQYPVLLNEQKAKNIEKDEILSDNISIKNNKITKIQAITKLNTEPKTGNIYKENRSYIQVISFDYLGDMRFGQEFVDEKIAEIRQEMPHGYQAKQLNYNPYQLLINQQYQALLLALVLITIICLIVFENLWLILQLLIFIPITFIATFLTFYLLSIPFNQGAWGAFILISSFCTFLVIVSLYDNAQTRKKNNLLKSSFIRFSIIWQLCFAIALWLLPFIFEENKNAFWFSFSSVSICSILCLPPIILFILPALLKKEVR